jgi:hypothetical protein
MEINVTTRTYKFIDEVEYDSDSYGTLVFQEEDILCRIEKKMENFNILITNSPTTENKIILNLHEKIYESFLANGLIKEINVKIETIH